MWALDIVLDTCVDDTLRVVYGVIVKILALRNSAAKHRHMCRLLCPDLAANSSSSSSISSPEELLASACVAADSSVLTQIRVITSDTTLLETRSENIAFASSAAPSSGFFISVQVTADQAFL